MKAFRWRFSYTIWQYLYNPTTEPMYRANKLAKTYGVSQMTVFSWARGENFPHPNLAEQIINDLEGR